ncbi:DUF5317 domain-containing protein [Radiobacillus kanasensis]|uniref:DUF5317 domain-containing protein n=1 Tax=Radiobacillus kanasensis TaxID=2844358 RepID=UPI001E65A269|nr:DUF5317 domain-containing protein [Radiobacillus kanasensis]UFT98629.1 DUF5317 domain-containing protein [Radiobacillus kanasensis]
MVIDGIILSVIVGFIRKGNLSKLTQPLFKWGWMFPLLLAIQLGVFYFQNKVEWIGQASGYVYIIVYVLGLLFLWVNRHQKGLPLVFVGVFLNFLVMITNGGRMPVSAEAAAGLDPMYMEAIKNGFYAKHELLTQSTTFAFLGDIIPVGPPYPRSQVISIGDVIMNVGIFLFIQDLMLNKDNENSHISYESSDLKGGEIQ